MTEQYKTNRHRTRFGFTLIELLIVIMIIGILTSAFVVSVNSLFRSARITRTTATLQKIDGILADRQKGLERAFAGATFRQFAKRQYLIRQYRGFTVDYKGATLVTLNRVPGLSEKASEVLSRKDWQRYYFPQGFADYIIAAQLMGLNEDKGDPLNGAVADDGIPDRIQIANKDNSNFDMSKHTPETESAEMLYFSLTNLEVFGVPPIGDDAFNTQELQDTDGDGLLEIVDGWDNPVRFYRWPTRLLKPYGLAGIDRQPGTAGVDDDGYAYSDGSKPVDDVLELSTPGTDDLDVSADQRIYAGLYFSGLPRKPTIAGQYDLLNEEPTDPYGLILAEVKRLGANGIDASSVLSEALYHTIDTYHKPIVVSAGPDGLLGLLEPNHNEDA
ncbi:MAG: type II secretion system protein, partial [Planctomycetota bacterium]|nr:type II secretion system protein [Planctomycetota bacterium]